jgi:hypothetical protein
MKESFTLIKQDAPRCRAICTATRVIAENTNADIFIGQVRLFDDTYSKDRALFTLKSEIYRRSIPDAVYDALQLAEENGFEQA